MQWEILDTWIALTAALVAMSCAVPGTFLVLRRQSMVGDALSHTALPGIVAAFLFAHWMRVMAITFPTLVFQPLGFENVRDTNTAGVTGSPFPVRIALSTTHSY